MFISYKHIHDLLIAHDCVEKLEDVEGITYWLDEEDQIKLLKADIEALKVDVARLDGRLTGVGGRLTGIRKQISHATNVIYGLNALVVVAIGIPAWRGKRDREQERRIEELAREIENLKQQRIVNP